MDSGCVREKIEGCEKVSKMDYERIKNFSIRFDSIRNRLELLKLEEEIISYMDTDEYIKVSDYDKNELDDILMEIKNKKEYYQAGCDPWKKIMGDI